MATDRRAQDFVRDIEVYVSGLAPDAQPAPDVTPLIEQAYTLAQRHQPEGWLRWGSSGLPITGESIAVQAEATITVLRRIGWNPSDTACRSIRDAMILATREDETGRLSEDTRYVVRDILSDLIRAMTGAPYANYELWDMHPHRKVDEVYALLGAAAAFARTYGAAEAAAA
ncbi:hypothetical protein ACIBBE_43430 [Streptomyces sp. NPDC051644]|uniref:DUF6197 family protein n=1 Tax=Streptomyces sp. NPDC051644 TaxID=3365666 RepID=UPI00378C2288